MSTSEAISQNKNALNELIEEVGNEQFRAKKKVNKEKSAETKTMSTQFSSQS